MDKINLLQKAYSKIQEFKDWNIKVESEKVKFQDLTNKNLELRKHNESLKKENVSLVEKFNISADVKRKKIQDLNKEIDELKLQVISSEKITSSKIKENGTALLSKENELTKIASEIKTSKDELKKISKEISSYKEEKELIKKDIDSLSKMSMTLSEEIKSLQDSLREAGATIEFAKNREKDLKIYERRIQRYYDEAGLKIKI